jgi:hypothetical protein
MQQLSEQGDMLQSSLQEVVLGKRPSRPFVQGGTREIPHLYLFRRLEALKLSLEKLIEGWDVFDLALNMSLILLILYAGNFWYLRVPVSLLCVTAILHPPLRHSKIFWLIVTTVVAVSNYYNWHEIDNHKYLITYWCLALFCSLLTAHPAKTIALNARLLIGLVFLFATLWKIISGDYLNGAFFHFTLLLDTRFESVAAFFGGLTGEVFQQNHQALRSILAYNSTHQVVQLQASPQIFWLAQLLTWWTVSTEGLIAVAFLWPEGKLISRWRDLPLLLFLLTTYLIAPVVGFGWVLVTMGMAQCTSSSKYICLFYLVAFLVIQTSYLIS